MARLPRLVVPGAAHHLVHRTVAHVPLCEDAAELRLLKAALQRASSEQRVLIHAYRLVPQHLQLLATPSLPESLARMMQALARFYVPALNRRRGRTGALWHGRFQVAPVGGAEPLLACMRYLEERGDASVERQEGAGATSADAHAGGLPDPLLAAVPSGSAYWRLGNTPFEREATYRVLLADGLSAEQRQAIESTTLRGWAYGTGEFLASLDQAGSRRHFPLSAGRPAKAALV